MNGALVPVEEPGAFGSAVLGIGWLQGTTSSADRASLLAWLGSWFGEVTERRTGLQWYARSWSVGPLVTVGAEPRSASSRADELFVTVPQRAFDELGWRLGAELLGALVKEWGLRPSRLDVYLDDRSRVADPADVLRAMVAGNVRSHVRTWRTVADGHGGMTVYLGSRTGDAMLRVYRKWAESKDPTQGVRWEMECRGERAPLVAAMLLGTQEPAARFVALLRAFVDFVDRAGVSRGDRAPLVPWWDRLVRGTARMGVALAVVPRTLARQRAWVVRQVAPTLALLVGADGPDNLAGMIREAWERARWDLVPGGPRWAFA